MSQTTYGGVDKLDSARVDNITPIDIAIEQLATLAAGLSEKNVASVSSPYSLTVPESQAQTHRLHGTRGSALTAIFDPDVAPWIFAVLNDATTQTITVKVTSGGAGVAIPTGKQRVLLHNGTNVSDITDAIGAGAWTSWVPTWTSLSLGNGTVEAKYIQIGKLVICRLHLVWGSTTSISGGVSFTLPVTQLAYGGSAFRTPLGNAMFFDASVGGSAGQFAGDVLNESTTKAYLTVRRADGTYSNLADLSSTVPFTWTTSDEIHCQFEYEAA